jgi:hypothetical protein
MQQLDSATGKELVEQALDTFGELNVVVNMEDAS